MGLACLEPRKLQSIVSLPGLYFISGMLFALVFDKAFLRGDLGAIAGHLCAIALL